MFIGEYNHTIDNKKRLAIPSKFRRAFKSKAVITKGLDNCLFLYPIKEWEILAEKLSKLPISQSGTRAFARLMLAGAMDVQVDKQGRITIPANLREHGQIDKEVVTIGVSTRVEVWGKERWEDYNDAANINYDNILIQRSNITFKQ